MINFLTFSFENNIFECPENFTEIYKTICTYVKIKQILMDIKWTKNLIENVLSVSVIIKNASCNIVKQNVSFELGIVFVTNISTFYCSSYIQVVAFLLKNKTRLFHQTFISISLYLIIVENFVSSLLNIVKSFLNICTVSNVN